MTFLVHNPRVVLVLPVLLLALLFVGSFVYRAVSPASQVQRTNAIALMRAEIAHLSPYPGSKVLSDSKINSFAHDPSLDIIYSLPPGDCSALQSYFARRAILLGWTVISRSQSNAQSSSAPREEALSSSYQKYVDGYTLDLLIDCPVPPSSEANYELGMAAY